MKIKSIEIEKFRHLNNVNFSFGKVLTIIAGGNGIGKTSLLGLIGHIFNYDNKINSLLNEKFTTKYSSVFRFSESFDSNGDYKYKLIFKDNSIKKAELRITTEKGKTRHRIDVGGRIAQAGKMSKPVIFLSLKRLIPLAQERESSISFGTQNLSTDYIQEYNKIYNEIFSTQETIQPVHTKSVNKNSFSPTTDYFDSHGISAGQDNIGQIILSILSFKKLKQDNSSYNGGLLLIDELDATLYPAVQRNLLDILLTYGRELNLQVIFTTHSSDLLNYLSSKNGSKFKHDSNFVGLSNSLGKVEVKEGFNELSILLHDLNHEALKTIKPKKINFYFEDKEAYLFFKNIFDTVDIQCTKNYKNLSISCGIYKSLIDKGFEEFFRSVVVLDGDFKGKLDELSNNSVVFLPGSQRPENIIKDFLTNLPDNDILWNNSSYYTKKVFLQNIKGVKDDRDNMKIWFNNEVLYWGNDGSLVFRRWIELNPSDTEQVINRAKFVCQHILDNYYDLLID